MTRGAQSAESRVLIPRLGGRPPMSTIVYRVVELTCALVRTVPVGTNRALVYVFWMLMSGQLLAARGAAIPGLSACGWSAPVVRRAWAAVGAGAGTSAALLTAWEATVTAEGRWQPLCAGGYPPVAADRTACW